MFYFWFSYFIWVVSLCEQGGAVFYRSDCHPTGDPRPFSVFYVTFSRLRKSNQKASLGRLTTPPKNPLLALLRLYADGKGEKEKSTVCFSKCCAHDFAHNTNAESAQARGGLSKPEQIDTICEVSGKADVG